MADTLVELLHNTSFPLIALIFVVPVASGVGNAEPIAPPAICTKKCPLAGIVPLNVVLLEPHVVPVAEVYWIDHEVMVTGLPELLYNSTKSFKKGAPLFPPPPYTSLITTCAFTVEMTANRKAIVATYIFFMP